MKNYFRYIYAILAIPLAILLRFALVPFIGYGIPYIMLFPVTVGVALLAGLGPAVLTGLLGSIITDYFFVQPLHTITLDIGHLTRASVMVLTSIFVGYVGNALKVARAKAEQQALSFQESEARLKRSQEIAHLGSWELDLVNNVLLWSDEIYRIFGLQPQEFGATYEAFLEAVHPEDRVLVNDAYSGSLREGRDTYEVEHRIVRKDTGEIRYVHERCEHVRNESGQIIRSVGMVHDITERKQSEIALQQSLDRFELLALSAGELLQSSEPQKSVESICWKVMEHLGCHAFFNFLVDEKAGKLHLNACAGIPEEEAKKIEWLDYGVAVCGCAARDAVRIVAEHIPTTLDERTELVKSYGIKAYCCHPLLGPGGKVIGTLSFGTCGRETFSPEDLSLMKAVTDQVAVAMVRMSGKQALEKAREELEVRVQERTAELVHTFEELEEEISERKKVERDLSLANTYNRSLIEASLDPLVTIDADGKITDVNIATEKVTGCSREELIGDYFPDYFTDLAKAEAGYQEVFKKGLVTDYELEVRHKDGHITPVLYNASVFRNEEGKVIGVFAAARDITERRRAEELARFDEARTNSVLRISQHPAASLRELLDFALDEAIGISGSKFGYLYFYHEDTQDFVLHAWSKDVMTECTIANPQTDYKLEKTGIWGEVVRQRKPIIVNDFPAPHPLKKGYPEGHAPLLRFFSVPVFSEGRIVAVVGFANRDEEYTDRDVSQMTLLMDSVWKIVERKQAEEQIKKLNQELEARVIERTAELENSNRELEAFSYSVSHDLRSPLRSIAGFSQVLWEDYADKLDEEGIESLQRIQNATQRMGQLIDDLLKLSRVTRSEMKRELIDLSDLARKTVKRLQETGPERNVEFIISNGLTVQGDEHLLGIVLENLFGNALKFTEKNRSAVVEFGAKPPLSPSQAGPVYFVRDNGAGFSMEYAGKLFNPFQRLHPAKEFSGTGIGLATVKRIINRHGGEVRIEGEVGKGATVYFTLG